jgi:hypothetical protein
MTVEDEHVYRVASMGVLVHNMCAMARQPASEKTATDMARRIERDLGQDARTAFHDAKEPGLGDRTLEELKDDARALYEAAGKAIPRWMQ